MTALERVQRTKRSLSVIVAFGSVFWAAAAVLAVLILGTLLAAVVAMPPVARLCIQILAGLVGIGTLVYMLWRGRFAWSFPRVALWIEEHAPQLRYALVTAIDPRYAESMGPAMEPVIEKVDTAPFVRDAAVKMLLPGLGALILTALIFGFMPTRLKGTLGVGNIFNIKPPAPTVMGNRLIPLTATLTPPAYANMREQTLKDPATITGLMGSHVVLMGDGVPDGITASLGVPDSVQKSVPVTANGNGWKITMTFTDSVPMALTLHDAHPSRKKVYERTIVIDPRVDQPPTAKLLLPLRDTTLRGVTGTLTLSADLNDDIGLGHARFEYIISKMTDEEKAQVDTGSLAAQTFGGARSGHIGISIPYSKLPLAEGALLSIRAVVWDNNTLYGPGRGYSETRTIRIATKAEYDSLAVNPAPPSADTAMQTLRMLIIATEKLDKQKGLMERHKFVDSSYKLAGVAEGIRQKIQRILDDQTGGGEVAADPRLQKALDAMFDAGRSLMIAETGEAIPPLYVALHNMQDYAKAKKYYLRGKIQVEPVNIDRVRLAGKDSVKAMARMARPVDAADRPKLEADYTSAILTLKTSPDSAVEMMTLMRVETLRKYPELAAALGDAVTAIQSKKDPSTSLTTARQIINGQTGTLHTIPVWSGAW